MSEFKFFCPHCGQHIACEEAYTGRQTQCPACLGALVVPEPPANRQQLRLAPASPRPVRTHRVYPVPGDPGVWTEEAWAKHAAEIEKRHKPQLSLWARALVVLLLFSPSIAAVGAKYWGRQSTPDLLFLVLFLFAIALAAVATYLFEGSAQPYVETSWDPGGGVNALLLLLGVLILLLGDPRHFSGWSWRDRQPWSWNRLWIGAVSGLNFLVIFACWLETALG